MKQVFDYHKYTLPAHMSILVAGILPTDPNEKMFADPPSKRFFRGI